MSQENVEIVTRAIAAAIARPKPDYSTVNELYASDHVLVPAGAASGIEGEGKGAEGFRAWRQEIEELLCGRAFRCRFMSSSPRAFQVLEREAEDLSYLIRTPFTASA